MALILTAAGLAKGYALTTYITGFTSGSGVGPLGVLFTGPGNVIYTEISGARTLTGGSTLDGQTYASLTQRTTYPGNNASSLAALNGHYYMTQFDNSKVVEIDANGAYVQDIAGPSTTPVSINNGVLGIAADTILNVLWVSGDQGGRIFKIDPVAKTVAVLATAPHGSDACALSADARTLFMVQTVSAFNVLGYDTTTGTKTFDSIALGQAAMVSPDGIGVYGSVLIVNDNSGVVYEVPIDGSAITTIASGGSRGDFVSVHPNGSLLLTQSTTIMRLVVPLNPPTGLAAIANCGNIALTWNAGFGATGYNVYRAVNPRGGYQPIGTSASPGYTDAAVQSGVAYYYVVTSTNAGRESGFSGEAAATALPQTPAGISAAGGCAQIALTWQAMTCAGSYNVYRSNISSSAFALVGSPAGPSYADVSVVPGQRYFYRVAAVGASGETPLAQSPEYAAASALPGTPMAVTATAGDKVVTLTWSPVTGVSTYNIYRGLCSGGELAAPLAMGITTTAYGDASAVNGTHYFYYVRAVSPCGVGMVSAEVDGVPQCCAEEYVTESPNTTMWMGKACV